MLRRTDPNATPADPTATPADPTAGNGSAPVAITAPYTPTTDPNANNIGQNAPNEVLHLMITTLDQVRTVLCLQ